MKNHEWIHWLTKDRIVCKICGVVLSEATKKETCKGAKKRNDGHDI